MNKKDILYKDGAWRMESAENSVLNKQSLLLSVIEKLKTDIENHDPNDKRAQKIINDLLYHYCWKVNEKSQK